ncbi:MAG: membrane protein insertion efficiency factor YidD [Firmicutes bacterium]|nr:membrane protein insertion efficiency factor YidD [Bacillota bacterium]
MKKIIEFFALFPIYFYRFVIKPWLPKSCAFTPTCSEYTILAIKQHGIFIGWMLGVWRILRCNPFNKNAYGYDPVPKTLRRKKSIQQDIESPKGDLNV